MGRLDAAARKRLPAKDFAGPHRSFPENNRSHDEAAIRDAPRAVKAGHITSGEAREIVAEAKRKLGKS